MGKQHSDQLLMSDYSLNPSSLSMTPEQFLSLQKIEQPVQVIPMQIMQIPTLSLSPQLRFYTPKVMSPVDQTIDVAWILASLPQIHEQKSQQHPHFQPVFHYNSTPSPPRIISELEAAQMVQQKQAENRVLKPLLSSNQETVQILRRTGHTIPKVIPQEPTDFKAQQNDMRLHLANVLASREHGIFQDNSSIFDYGTPLRIQTQNNQELCSSLNTGNLLAVNESMLISEKHRTSSESSSAFHNQFTSVSEKVTESVDKSCTDADRSFNADKGRNSLPPSEESTDCMKRKTDLAGSLLPFKKRKFFPSATPVEPKIEREKNDTHIQIKQSPSRSQETFSKQEMDLEAPRQHQVKREFKYEDLSSLPENFAFFGNNMQNISGGSEAKTSQNRTAVTPKSTNDVKMFSPMTFSSCSSPALSTSSGGSHSAHDNSGSGSEKATLTCFIRHRSQNIPKEKSFTCNHENCDKAYAKLAHLKSHMRIHTGK